MAKLGTVAQEVRKFARAHPDETEKPPPIAVRFFYDSTLLIDDPLSPVPPPIASGATAAKQAPRPFSTYDHTELDKAWNRLRERIRKYKEKQIAEAAIILTDGASERSVDVPQSSVERGSRPPSRSSQPSSSVKVNPSICVGGRRTSDPKRALSSSPSKSDSFRKRSFEPHRSSLSRVGGERAFVGKDVASPVLDPVDDVDLDLEAESELAIAGTTGTPFIRAPSRSKIPSLWQKQSNPRPYPNTLDSELSADEIIPGGDAQNDSKKRSTSSKELLVKVPVGISRLHEVSMPDLHMLPIYWLPVQDISAVIRGTWFYKESMLPVETDVANLLEAGYVSMQPWTETWNDELNSAVEVGAVGETKIIHALWPPPEQKRLSSRPSSRMGITTEEPPEASPEMQRAELLQKATNIIEASTQQTGYDHMAAGESTFGQDGTPRKFLQSAVIYANAKEAYLLKPGLQPSAYYGRRPLASYIRKGHKIGVCVVRGFDMKAWNRLHPPKSGPKTVKAQQGVSLTQADGSSPNRGQKSNPRLSASLTPNVTDLVLVIHGIGQKLSERMESFHFTHAMNSFRREVHVELGSTHVRGQLRKEVGGMMVLPVNWRSVLSFEEGGYRDGPEDDALNHFTLKDITPESLPSVRNIISDVMLDIPYYLSHHQPKMISAVVKEANRIYDLWCKNNPGFESYGRVHLIAHSLGSVMAIDILSKQPTSINHSSLAQTEIRNASHFAFDTKNLFLCGSPAGFFLLLKKAVLLPRRGRDKPGADGEDSTPGVAGDEGTYGCLAVDNIYNIINPYDPVAYRMNATVDAAYATSLKPAFVPSATVSWFAFSNPFKAAPPAEASKRRAIMARLPSNVELETHNFTREEIAEKRAHLLNDNGQIDFFLRYGGGPLEIQYLTMLGAHSSYWLSRDFVRFVVLEAGRRLGREGTVESARAVKKKNLAA